MRLPEAWVVDLDPLQQMLPIMLCSSSLRGVELPESAPAFELVEEVIKQLSVQRPLRGIAWSCVRKLNNPVRPSIIMQLFLFRPCLGAAESFACEALQLWVLYIETHAYQLDIICHLLHCASSEAAAPCCDMC